MVSTGEFFIQDAVLRAFLSLQTREKYHVYAKGYINKFYKLETLILNMHTDIGILVVFS